MATATRQRSRSSLVKPETVGQAIAFLQELPEKPKEDLSLKAAVEQMQHSIRDTLSKGYSYDDVANMLSEKGITISALTLKNYVPSGKRQAAKTAAKAKPKRTKKTPETALPEATETDNGSMVTPVEGTVSEPAAESPAPTKPRRGRGRAAAKPAAEGETTAKPTRGRKPSATPKEAGATATARKRRQPKATAS